MSWKCPECGFEGNTDTRPVCDGCGYADCGTLALLAVDTGEWMRLSIDTAVGRRLLRTFAGSDAAYASDPQFWLRRDPERGGWTVTHASDAHNPSYAGGTPIGSSPTPVEPGATLSIGPDRLRLRVSIERRSAAAAS